MICVSSSDVLKVLKLPIMLPELTLRSPKVTDSICEVWSMISNLEFQLNVEMVE